MSTVILKHKITGVPVGMPCEQWEAWKDVPEMREAFEVVEGSAGCTTCGDNDPVVEEVVAPENKASKVAAKTTSKESE